MIKQNRSTAGGKAVKQATNYDYSAGIGRKIVERARQAINEKRLSCHGDGPGYNDHSTGDHSKAVP